MSSNRNLRCECCIVIALWLFVDWSHFFRIVSHSYVYREKRVKHAQCDQTQSCIKTHRRDTCAFDRDNEWRIVNKPARSVFWISALCCYIFICIYNVQCLFLPVGSKVNLANITLRTFLVVFRVFLWDEKSNMFDGYSSSSSRPIHSWKTRFLIEDLVVFFCAWEVSHSTDYKSRWL